MRDELSGGEPTDIAACKDTYERLRPSTAQQVLRFHRMQQNAPRERRAWPDEGCSSSSAAAPCDPRTHSSSFDPASAPIAVTSAVESVYQVATNSGESSVQCEAYSVAASPADNIPAMAPATRRPRRRAVTQADQRAGQDRQRHQRDRASCRPCELLPTSRVIIGSRCGIIISPPMPAVRSRPGSTAASRSRAARLPAATDAG